MENPSVCAGPHGSTTMLQASGQRGAVRYVRSLGGLGNHTMRGNQFHMFQKRTEVLPSEKGGVPTFAAAPAAVRAADPPLQQS